MCTTIKSLAITGVTECMMLLWLKRVVTANGENNTIVEVATAPGAVYRRR
jgi:hypothetical protein